MVRNVVARHEKRAAGKPYLESMGLTKSKAMNDEAAMLYSIDAGRNKSKYYEMLILVNDDGSAQLIKRWGRLGARFQSKTEEYRDLDSAKRALLKTKRSKMKGSSAYRDAFDSRQHKTPDGKQLPKGQYPVGLSSNAGPWQNQDIQTCKPALRQLVTVIEEAIADAANEDMSGVLTDLQVANGYISELGTSSMAREIQKKIKAPLSRLTGTGRHRADPDKIVRELKTLSRYLSKQLSMCMTASVVDRTAATKTATSDEWAHAFLRWLEKSHEDLIGPFDVGRDALVSDLWEAVSGNAGYPREGKAATQKAIAKFMGKWLKAVDDWYKWEARNSHLLDQE